MPNSDNRNSVSGQPYRRTRRRGSARMSKSVLLAVIFVAVVLILVGIYIFFNDVKMPVVLSIS